MNMTRQRMLKWTAALVFGLAACDGNGPEPCDILLTVAGSIFQPDSI
jgi:hypothetical protein